MRKLLLPIMFCAFSAIAESQITIQPVIPLGGMIQKSVLWNLALINTAPGPYDCRLELTLRERATGIEVMNATTGMFTLPSGAKQVNASQLFPIQYNLLSPSFSSRPDDFIPIGNYTACYRLTAGKFVAAEECALFDVEPLNPPMLVNPADSSVTEIAPSQFSWIPPAPFNLFNRLQYEVNIVEISEGQKAEEAIQQNLPFYTEPNIQINNLPYTNGASSFEKDKWYAWQVTARDDMNYAGKSEVWVFKVKQSDYVQMIEQNAPFVQMSKTAPQTGFAINGRLRLSFVNELSDTVHHIQIRSLEKQGGATVAFPLSISPGENLIEFEVAKRFKLNEGELYEAFFINGSNERWTLLFRIQNLNK